METKNILIIKGGGRPNGNTAQLIDSFTKGAREKAQQGNAGDAQ